MAVGWIGRQRSASNGDRARFWGRWLLPFCGSRRPRGNGLLGRRRRHGTLHSLEPCRQGGHLFRETLQIGLLGGQILVHGCQRIGGLFLESLKILKRNRFSVARYRLSRCWLRGRGNNLRNAVIVEPNIRSRRECDQEQRDNCESAALSAPLRAQYPFYTWFKFVRLMVHGHDRFADVIPVNTIARRRTEIIGRGPEPAPLGSGCRVTGEAGEQPVRQAR